MAPANRVAADTVTSNPDDAEANLTVGKFWCLRKGDWDGGLLLLPQSMTLFWPAYPPEVPRRFPDRLYNRNGRSLSGHAPVQSPRGLADDDEPAQGVGVVVGD